MNLLSNMRLDRVEAECGRLKTGEPEHIVAHDDVRLAHDRVSEGDVEPERLAVRLSGERAGRSIAPAVVDHAPVRNVRMLGIGCNAEIHEVTEFESRRTLETIEQSSRCTDQAQIDVLGGAGALDAKLNDETALEHRAIAELAYDARTQSVEHQKLAPAPKVDSAGRH